VQWSGVAEISDLSDRSYSVCHFLGIHELSIGLALTPVASCRVIVRHLGRNNKLFQELDALSRSDTPPHHENQVVQIHPAEAFKLVILDDIGDNAAALLLPDFQPASVPHCFTVPGLTFSRLAMTVTE